MKIDTEKEMEIREDLPMTKEMEIRDDLSMAKEIARRVNESGGHTYYVGGYVRDKILGIENKDVDIEIHGLKPEQLARILDELGERVEMGASFGVYGLKGYDLDIAMPRKEKAIGKGHKDFEVFVDPFLGTEKAAKRRDFTINALMEDVLSGEIIDHFHGLDDLEEGRIRHVNDETFVEDPLRLFRGAQFAARFHFTVAAETSELCEQMDVSTLAKERVFGEMKKALMKSDRPSIFFEELRKMKQLSVWFPEVEALIGVGQNTDYHREGDVWVHTMLVLDEAAKRRNLVKQPLNFMIAALCHDFGKAVASEVKDGKIHAYEHEIKGIPLAKTFLERISAEKQLMEYVLNMVKLHMKPHMMAYTQSALKKTNKMFDEAVEPLDLVYLTTCDAMSARTYDRDTPPESPIVENFRAKVMNNEAFLMERLKSYEECMARPSVMGRDLIGAGLKPDKNFSEILAYAHKLHLAGIDKENALKQTLAYARKMSPGSGKT